MSGARVEAGNGSVKLSESERIKERSQGLRAPLAEELENDRSHLSEEAKQVLKFHGSYQQDDRDVRRQRRKAGLEPDYSFMIRSKIPGGVLTAAQYLVHDQLADRYGDGTLRITTRQGIQLYGVVKGDLHGTIRSLNESLVTTLGACGDVGRNTLGCPAPLPGELRDRVLGWATSLSDHLLPRSGAYHEIWVNGEKVEELGAEAEPIYGMRYLPRKFKTAFAFPEDNCTDLLSNDLGFLVIANGSHLEGFNVVVGGGLGRTHNKPETYPRLADPLCFVRPEQLIEVATAVLTTQRDYGDRVDRRQARLKYLIDRMGLDWFRTQVEERVGRPLKDPEPVQVTDIHDHLGWHGQGEGRLFLGIFVENGRIQDLQHVRLRTALRTLAERFSPGVRLTPQQNVLLTDIPKEHAAEVDAVLDDHGVLPVDRISTVRRWSMACPALPTCALALAESERVFPSVVDELEDELRRLGLDERRFTVRMTGCPNGCARPYTADIAFVGRSLNKYVVYLGGNIEGTRLAEPYADLVHRDDLVSTVRPVLERYRDERFDGEPFGDFCVRVGPEAVLQTAGREP